MGLALRGHTALKALRVAFCCGAGDCAQALRVLGKCSASKPHPSPWVVFLALPGCKDLMLAKTPWYSVESFKCLFTAPNLYLNLFPPTTLEYLGE